MLKNIRNTSAKFEDNQDTNKKLIQKKKKKSQTYTLYLR